MRKTGLEPELDHRWHLTCGVRLEMGAFGTAVSCKKGTWRCGWGSEEMSPVTVLWRVLFFKAGWDRPSLKEGWRKRWKHLKVGY